jgi:hypothetical protein
VAHASDVARAATATGLLRALERGGGRDIFHDPFDDPAEPGAPPVRLVLVGTAEEDPGTVALRHMGRDRAPAAVLHPVDEVARGVPHAGLLRAGLLASRFDVAAVYLGLATRTIAPA